MKIEITALGIYGLMATEDNPHGEYPIGTELEVDSVPEGWLTKVRVISGKPKDGAELIVNDDAPRRGRPPKAGE